MLFYKIDHIGRCNFLQRNSFNPFGEIIGGNQNKLMSFARWRINLADQINCPSSERPRLDDRIHGRCGCPLNIAKLLTSLTPFEILKAILNYSWPIIPISSDHPLHLKCRLMCSTPPSWISPIKLLASTSPKHLRRIPSIVR